MTGRGGADRTVATHARDFLAAWTPDSVVVLKQACTAAPHILILLQEIMIDESNWNLVLPTEKAQK